jgi:demethylmenaquinone methyltransferase/2-methoxy-6-polyprenyl-1,4-benzoquinol methylase
LVPLGSHGLTGRDDVEIVTVEADPHTAALAAEASWWSRVHPRVGDALAVLEETGTFDLIFADAPAGKWTGLDRTIAALEPGGLLVVDDMRPLPSWDDVQRAAKDRVRDTMLTHPDLVGVELDAASGIVLAVKRRRLEAEVML